MRIPSLLCRGLLSRSLLVCALAAPAGAEVPIRVARPVPPSSFTSGLPHGERVYLFDMGTASSPVPVGMSAGRPEVKPELPFEGDPRLVIHRDVPYGNDAPARQNLDAYLVKSSRPTPVLIEVHGGGWRRGAKSQFVYAGDLMEKILQAGISVVSINYRLTPGHRFPAQMEDIARAVQFVRSKAGEWNLDPDRIAAMGGSAGGHLSAWLALHDELAQAGHSDPVRRQSTRLRGAVVLWAPVDLTRVRPTELALQPNRGQDFANAFTAAFGCTEEEFEKDPEVRKKIREASPLFLVTPDDPPLLVMGPAGEEMSIGNHPPVPEVINDPHSAWHGVLLAEALRKTGIEVTTRIGPFVGKDAAGDSAAILEYLRRRLPVDAGR